jgi:sarcosine oxidase, subunit beta
MARIVVVGSGAMGASVAYHLALLGADDVVVAERGELVSGSTARAMGGVRQQFSTPEEVVLARESIDFLAALGPQFFR